MHSQFRSLVAFGLAILAASPAHAEWHVAKSTHFVIYANDRADRLRGFAQRLEKFDKAVRVVRNMTDPPVGDGNRLTIFVLSSDAEVQRLMGDKTGMASGVYMPRATGSLAIVPRRAGRGEDDLAERILLHEYAHHLMLNHSSAPYPEWLVEGFAEFMSTAREEKNGSVLLGEVPTNRAYGLLMGNPLPLQSMITGDYGKLSRAQREAIYGRGWLLTHYLTFEPSRRGQVEKYVALLSNGTKPSEAAVASFGDLKQLEKETESYLRRRRLTSIQVAPHALAIGPVEVAPLSKGAAAVMPLRIESKRGVNRTTAGPLADRIRAIAAAYPDDPMVQVTLAEAEFDARNYQSAEAAADRVLARDPRNTEAMIYKGRAMIRLAEHATSDRRQRFAAARKWFIQANKIDTEDPEPLLEFYKSYAAEGVRPTANALSALHYAADLAPQDLGVRMTSGTAYLHEGKFAEARRQLQPVANNPHARDIAEVARKMLALIDARDVQGALRAGQAPPSADPDDER